MYIPPSNVEERLDVLHDYIQSHPFATLVTASATGPYVTHLPVVLKRDVGRCGTLHAHLAKANPHHRQAILGEALAIFLGPDAYITPSWYASKAEHGKVVPTWNYIAVHAYGSLRFTEDPEFLRPHLEALTTRHESRRAEPWAVSDAPADYLEQMRRAIVGVELTITRIEGKWKMSQNRPAADIDGVVRGLSESALEREREVGRTVQRVRPDRSATS